MPKNKYIKKSIIIAIIAYIILTAFHISFAGTLSADINGINDSKYPGVKSALQNLKSKHSNYNFKVYYTGIDWTEAVTMEYQGHGSSPKNLFAAKSNYTGKWYCPICGSKSYDTGWYCASIEAIKYMMDPRNSLDETSLYQFKSLETPDASAGNIQTIINNKYSSFSYINNQTAINAIINASSKYNMNGYSILAKIINEQGAGSSVLVRGTGYNGQYVGYYNFFNVGAYGNGTSTVILNGLKYAANSGWNTVEKSILGGSEYYKSQYIAKGQNTLYYQRFNVVYATSLFSHQYQQDIMGAQTSAGLLKSFYTTTNTANSINHTFIIPLYENMPAIACSRPSTTENSKLNYEESTVLTNKLAVRAAPNSSRIISYLNKNEKIKVLTRATQKSSDGNYWDIIVSNTDGSYGYVLRSGISQKEVLPKYIFDSEYYANNNADLKKAFGDNEQELLNHYLNFGVKEGRASSATFDVKYYVENNKDIKNAFGNDYVAAFNHFKSSGCNEYRRSSKEFDGTFYRYFHSDLTNFSSVQLLNHYLSYGKSEGRLACIDVDFESVLFDANIYASCNSDVKNAFGNNTELLRRHWISCGIAEGRIATFVYEGIIYRTMNTDLQKTYGTNYKKIFEHFVRFGYKEKRTTSLLFDISTYLSKNSDIQKAYGTNYKEIYLHFKKFGITEGRSASLVFEVTTYLNSNVDLARAYGKNYKEAYIHFLNFGIKEIRKTSSVFNLAYYINYQDLRNTFGTNYKQYYIHYLLNGRLEGRRAV